MTIYDSVPSKKYFDPAQYGSDVRRSMPLFSTLGKGPQGVKGDKGDKGDTGPQGKQGAAGPRGEVGPRGLRGKDLTFKDLSEKELEEIYAKVAYIGNEIVSDVFTTLDNNTTTVPIPIDNWQEYDILLIDVEGLDIVEGRDYTISGNVIQLVDPIVHQGTRINFRAIKADIPERYVTKVIPSGASASLQFNGDDPFVEVEADENGYMTFSFYNIGVIHQETCTASDTVQLDPGEVHDILVPHNTFGTNIICVKNIRWLSSSLAQETMDNVIFSVLGIDSENIKVRTHNCSQTEASANFQLILDIVCQGGQ